MNITAGPKNKLSADMYFQTEMICCVAYSALNEFSSVNVFYWFICNICVPDENAGLKVLVL